jgi:serine/threonine-protein kinase
MFRANTKIGKYRIQGRLGEGGFSTVYRALDMVEGVPVALKVPHSHLLTPETKESFRKEIRLTAQLDHKNILPVKNAEYYDGHLVVASPLGDETLVDRLSRRMAAATAFKLGEQMLEALAYAHSYSIIHCDVKPENLILFPENMLRLADFGIARVALQTMPASGSGTIGYVAPEQAMGKPSFRSDVFSAGLVLYRMLSGTLPEWPYQWPLPGQEKLRQRYPSSLLDFFRRALHVDQRKRFADAERMLASYRRLLPAVRRKLERRNGRRPERKPKRPELNWTLLRQRLFLRRYKKALDVRDAVCTRCKGPVSEAMTTCPWCGTKRQRHLTATKFPARCPRCKRGRKLDWRFCAWCFGSGFKQVADRAYTDKRYTGRCTNTGCKRKLLMPFQRYCAWCRRKVAKKWPLDGARDRCRSCGWGVVPTFWDFCPWCGKAAPKKTRP